MKKYICYLLYPLILPHLIAYSLSKAKAVLAKDVDRWSKCARVDKVLGGVKIALRILRIYCFFTKNSVTYST